MKKITFILLFSFLLPYFLFAQKNTKKNKDYEEDFEPGVDFIIGAGVYFGGKLPAGYYSGIPTNENNLDYLFGNKYWREHDLIPLIANNNQFVSSTDTGICVKYPDGYPMDMHYKPAMSISLGVSYRFTSHIRLSIYYNFARLTAKDVFLVSYTQLVSGNERPDYLQYLLVGKENRSLIDLTLSYTFHPNKIVHPFLEFGGEFNFVRVKSFQAVIENKEFNLLDIYGGSTYNGGYMQEFKPRYGGAGGAVMAAAGIKFAFNKSISIDPTFYVSYGTINLRDYKGGHFNFGAYVRIVMSDSIFQK